MGAKGRRGAAAPPAAKGAEALKKTRRASASKAGAGAAEAAPAAEKAGAEAAPAAEKAGAEIDALFGQLSKRKRAPAAAAGAETAAPKAAPTAKAPARGSKDDLFGNEAKARKRTEDGLALYSEAELGLARKDGGDTADCPFDCDCCF